MIDKDVCVVAGSFKVSLVIELGCPEMLGNRSGSFMIIRKFLTS